MSEQSMSMERQDMAEDGAMHENTQTNAEPGQTRYDVLRCLKDQLNEDIEQQVQVGSIRKQLNKSVSADTQDSIKAGLVRTQLNHTASPGTQRSIKDELNRTTGKRKGAKSPNRSTKQPPHAELSSEFEEGDSLLSLSISSTMDTHAAKDRATHYETADVVRERQTTSAISSKRAALPKAVKARTQAAKKVRQVTRVSPISCI